MTHDFLMILFPAASQPFVLVVGILLSVSLHDECGRRVAPICRQKVLRRLVVRANPLILSVQTLDLEGRAVHAVTALKLARELNDL